MSKPKIVELPKNEQNEVAPSNAPKEPIVSGISLLTPALLFSVLTATAYLIGEAFHQEYLDTFKIPYGLFPKSSAEYFIMAFRAVMEVFPSWYGFAGKNIGAIAMIFLGFCLLSLINVGGKRLDKSIRMKKLQNKVQSNKLTNLILEILTVPVFGLMALFYVPAALAILMILPVAIGNSSGAKAAKSEIAGYEGGCSKPASKAAHCTDVSESGTSIASGFIVDMSDKYVAIYVNGASQTIPIKDRDFLPYATLTPTPMRK